MDKYLQRIIEALNQAAQKQSLADYSELLDEVAAEAEARLDALKNEKGSV